MHQPAPSRPLPHSGTETALRVLGLAVLVLVCTTSSLPMLTEAAMASGPRRTGLALMLAVEAASAVLLLVRRVHMPTLWAMLGALTISTLLTGPGRFALSSFDLWSPGYVFTPLCLLAMSGSPRRSWRTFSIVGAATLMLAGAIGSGRAGGPWRWLVADALFIAQPVAEVGLFGAALLAASRARLDAATTRLKAKATRERQQDEVQARREAARMLHDHVLHALAAISHERSLTPAEDAVAESRTAWTAMTRPTRQQGWLRLEELLAADPALEAVGARLEGRSDPVPESVARTMAEATHEALNNVLRHSRAEHCTVRVLPHELGVGVEVVDDGVGFDPVRAAAKGRLGLARSVSQRMHDLDGEAHIISAPGEGTRVELAWPRTAPVTASVWLQTPDDWIRRVLTRTAWPSLLTSLLLTVIVGPTVPHRWPVMAVSLAVLLVGCRAAWTLARRPLTRLDAWVLGLAASVGWVVNLAVVTDPDTVYLLWMAWGSSALVHLVVLSSSLRTGTQAVIAWLAAQLVPMLLRYGVDDTLGLLNSAITSGAGEVLLALVTLAIVRRLGAQEAQDADQAQALQAAVSRVHRSSQLEHHWSQRVNDDALPLLRDVAAGVADVHDDAVRERARNLELTLRDELVLGPSHGALLEAFSRARADGWQLVSTLGATDSPVALEAARSMVEALGPAGAEGQRVTLSSRPSMLSAVVLQAAPQQAVALAEAMQGIGGDVVEDPDFLMLRLPLADQPPAASAHEETPRPPRHGVEDEPEGSWTAGALGFA